MATTADLRDRNVAFWAQAAAGWIKHADRQDLLGRPLGAAAMDWLRPAPGERILDVGCGCGGTTAELAEAVAPAAEATGLDLAEEAGAAGGVTGLDLAEEVGIAGEVTGLDLAESMVLAAAQRFPQHRYPRLRFVAADIETVDVIAGSPFDAAYSRMTLMLLADPVAGCATIWRALRPGGRLAATVFRDGSASPWLHAALLGAAPHVGSSLPPLPVGDEPGPFAFADPARVKRVLAEAGFGAIMVEPHDVTLHAPDEPDTVAEWLIDIGPAGAAYRAASPAQQLAARTAAAGLLARFRHPGSGYQLPTGLWLITAVAAS